MLQKTLKSIQLHLHEYFAAWVEQGRRVVTPSAWTQARAKLCHTAFIDLNGHAVLAPFYAPEAALLRATWQGHRLLAVDGSGLRVPDTAALWAHFGGHAEIINQKGTIPVQVPIARFSVLYDVLNNLGLEARVDPFATSELAQAVAHLEATQPGDLLVADRNYGHLPWLRACTAHQVHFVVRCRRSTFAAVNTLHAADQAGVSVTAELLHRRAKPGTGLTVRLVTLRLTTGELEVLATSLLDEEVYPTASFGEQPADPQEAAAPGAPILPAGAAPPAGARRRHHQQVNHAVSFHALKARAWDLLLGSRPVAEVMAELTLLFQGNPVCVRPGRHRPRELVPKTRIINFLKRVRKIVY